MTLPLQGPPPDANTGECVRCGKRGPRTIGLLCHPCDDELERECGDAAAESPAPQVTPPTPGGAEEIAMAAMEELRVTRVRLASALQAADVQAAELATARSTIARLRNLVARACFFRDKAGVDPKWEDETMVLLRSLPAPDNTAPAAPAVCATCGGYGWVALKHGAIGQTYPPPSRPCPTCMGAPPIQEGDPR